MLREAGHPWAQPEQHQHDAGCGHQQAEQPTVQRSAVHDVLRTSGRPLDDETRTDMETRLGADFSDVRVHDDTAARASAAQVGARAYTSGNHVVLGVGGADQHTLAHELTHVIQQRQGPVAGTDNGAGLRVSDPSDRFEREAESNATRAMRGPSAQAVAAPGATARPASATTGPVALQRMDMDLDGHSTTGGFAPPPLLRQRTLDLSRYEPSSDFRAHVQAFSNAQDPVRYGDVWVGDIVISDRDRPPTQYGDDGQNNHTTAWTLLRATLTSHANKAAEHLLTYIYNEVQELDSTSDALFVQRTRHMIPQFRAKIAMTQGLLTDMRNHAVPVQEWQHGLARLIRLYMEAYQLSPAASFGGRSGGDAEGHRMALLRREESRTGNDRMEPRLIMDTILRGLYEQPSDSGQRAVAEPHFWKTVATGFPNVTEYLAPHYQQLHDARTAVLGRAAQPTLQEYLRNPNDELLSPLDFGVLDSGFVADVEVDSHAYTGELWTSAVELSRRERPPTQFRPLQRSHTIAWKAIYEAAINATQEKPIGHVVGWAQRSLQFSRQSGPPADDEGRTSWETLRDGLHEKITRCITLLASGGENRPNFWEAMLSMLIRGCLTLENASRLATGGGPADENGEARGHGEAGIHQRLLYGGLSGAAATAEALGLLDTGALRTQSIRALMDRERQAMAASGQRPMRVSRHRPATIGVLERSRSLNEEIEGPRITQVLEHWADTSQEAYPHVQFDARAIMLEQARQLLRTDVDGSRGVPLSDRERNLFDIV
ncbi:MULTISPECIES: DUF4157 domain-containing protein [unclassified Streptomyces]|uniref:eCIS core domain-containing protein n=1 Tax=unclassified Streptomyces TaxID=2593676 RepID=UPI002966C6BE|nr:DUF4157 domain-containing protein [Streptomyces sp. SJL17-1]